MSVPFPERFVAWMKSQWLSRIKQWAGCFSRWASREGCEQVTGNSWGWNSWPLTLRKGHTRYSRCVLRKARLGWGLDFARSTEAHHTLQYEGSEVSYTHDQKQDQMCRLEAVVIFAFTGISRAALSGDCEVREEKSGTHSSQKAQSYPIFIVKSVKSFFSLQVVTENPGCPSVTAIFLGTCVVLEICPSW